MTDELCIRHNVEQWMADNTIRMPPDEWFMEILEEQCFEDERFTNDDGEWLLGLPEALFDEKSEHHQNLRDLVTNCWTDATYYAQSLIEESAEWDY